MEQKEDIQVSITLKTPDDIVLDSFKGLDPQHVFKEDHFVSEGSMSPMPNGKRLRVDMERHEVATKQEIADLIIKVNQQVYNTLSGTFRHFKSHLASTVYSA